MLRPLNYSLLVAVAAITAGLSSAGIAQSLTLDFDTDSSGNDIVHGQVIDNEYAGNGVQIWADNAVRSFDLATVYDSSGTIPNNRDPDLRSPWDGGNASNTQAGNLLIIQENDVGCSDGVCNRADDEGSRPAGSLFFDFNQAIVSTSFDLIDIEQPEVSGAYLALLDEDRNVISNSTITFSSLKVADNTITWGDNFYNKVSTIFFNTMNLTKEVFGLKFFMGGSGALNNVTVGYHSVPEIDAANASIGLALLIGIVALMRERRRFFLAS